MKVLIVNTVKEALRVVKENPDNIVLARISGDAKTKSKDLTEVFCNKKLLQRISGISQLKDKFPYACRFVMINMCPEKVATVIQKAIKGEEK